MGVKRSQIQNLIIYIGDVFGITIGYFLMSHIRFYPDIYGVWAQDNRVIYRWLVAIFVLTIVYLVIDPNQNFFKRKFWKEFWANFKTNLITAALMATVAYLIDDARAVSYTHLDVYKRQSILWGSTKRIFP